MGKLAHTHTYTHPYHTLTHKTKEVFWLKRK